jgi:hypothetical protein
MSEYRKLLEGAYRRYHELLESKACAPYSLYSYDICDSVREAEWPMVGAWSVPSLLREAINGVNAWRIRLHDWAIWVALKSEYSESEWWRIQHHFLEPTVFYCMYQPNAFSDKLLEMAEFAIHHANLAVDRSYKDFLVQDKQKQRKLKQRNRPTKTMRLEQLISMGQRWNKFQYFEQCWRQVDAEDYRRETRNFRNLASHSFAPRLTNGQIMRVTREVRPWENMERQEDGTYRLVPDPVKKGISYDFCVLDPLDLKEQQEINSREEERASKALDAYCALLQEVGTKLCQEAKI